MNFPAGEKKLGITAEGVVSLIPVPLKVAKSLDSTIKTLSKNFLSISVHDNLPISHLLSRRKKETFLLQENLSTDARLLLSSNFKVLS